MLILLKTSSLGGPLFNTTKRRDPEGVISSSGWYEDARQLKEFMGDISWTAASEHDRQIEI